jgi:hypothetical protein
MMALIQLEARVFKKPQNNIRAQKRYKHDAKPKGLQLSVDTNLLVNKLLFVHNNQLHNLHFVHPFVMFSKLY